MIPVLPADSSCSSNSCNAAINPPLASEMGTKNCLADASVSPAVVCVRKVVVEGGATREESVGKGDLPFCGAWEVEACCCSSKIVTEALEDGIVRVEVELSLKVVSVRGE